MKKKDVAGPSPVILGVSDTPRNQGVPDGINIPTGTFYEYQLRIRNIRGSLRDALRGPQYFLIQHLINKC